MSFEKELLLDKIVKYIDINECTEGTDNCQQRCTNTGGSFTCDCNTGYRLASDGHSCSGQSILSNVFTLNVIIFGCYDY